MKQMWLPTILASDGREYTNVSYTDRIKAEKALADFIEIFLDTHDDKIIDAHLETYFQ